MATTSHDSKIVGRRSEDVGHPIGDDLDWPTEEIGGSISYKSQGVQLEELSETSGQMPVWQDGDTTPSRFSCFTGRPAGKNQDSVGLSMESGVIGNVEDKHVDFIALSMEPGMIGTVEDKQLDLIKHLSNRAFSLGSMLELVCILLDKTEAFAKIPDLEATYLFHSGISIGDWPDTSFFDPRQTQTWEVTYRVFIPLTQIRCCALASVLNGHLPCLAQRMVSHTWQNTFLDTVAACVAAAQGKGHFFHIRPRLRTVPDVLDLMRELGTTALDIAFWICAISVNQHSVSCDRSPWPCPCGLQKVTHGPLSEVGSFDKMMHFLSKGAQNFSQVIAVDDESALDVQIDFDFEYSSLGDESTKRLDSANSLSSRPSAVYRSLMNRSSAPPLAKVSSVASLGSATLYYDWCGITLHLTSRCVVNVHEVPGVKLSRRVFVGDIIESIDGIKDKHGLKSLAFVGRDKMVLAIRRGMSVTTRIWVVAEIAEAQKRKIPQHVVAHFPLAFSGREARLRVRGANVKVAEASQESDREMILERIADGANEYNERLAKVLLVAPWNWKVSLMTLCVCILACILAVYPLIQEIIRGKPTWALVNFIALCTYSILFAICGYHFRYTWLGLDLHDPSLPERMREEMHHDIRRYLQPSRNPFWTRPMLATSYLTAKSLRQRFLALMLWIVIYMSLWTLYWVLARVQDDCGARLPGNRMCDESWAFFLAWQVIYMVGVSLFAFSLIEQHATLAGKGPSTFLAFTLPLVALHIFEAVVILNSLVHLVFYVFAMIACLSSLDVFSQRLSKVKAHVKLCCQAH